MIMKQSKVIHSFKARLEVLSTTQLRGATDKENEIIDLERQNKDLDKMAKVLKRRNKE